MRPGKIVINALEVVTQIASSEKFTSFLLLGCWSLFDIDIIRSLTKTKSNSQHVFVIAGQFFKREKAIPTSKFKPILAAKLFTELRVNNFGITVQTPTYNRL